MNNVPRLSTPTVSRHPQPGITAFLRRTIAAQAHLAACLAAIIGTVILVERCARLSDASHVWGCLIFGLSSILLFATSSSYHFLFDGFRISQRLEARLEALDQLAIYLFIAGTYTAVLMNTVSQPWSKVLLSLVWFVAALGTLYTLFRGRLASWAQHRFVYTGFYLFMGWLFALRLGEIVGHLSKVELVYFILGGLSYTTGAIIYAVQRPNFIKDIFGFHELWHLLVVFGFGFHYLLILSFY